MQDDDFMQHLTAANRAAGWPDPDPEVELGHASQWISQLLADNMGSYLDEAHCYPAMSEHPLARALNKEAVLAWDEHRKHKARNGSDFNPIGRTPVVRGFDYYPKPDIDNPVDMMLTPFCIVAGRPTKTFPLQELDDFLHVPYLDANECDVRLSANCSGDGWLRTALKFGQYVTVHRLCSRCQGWFWGYWYCELNPTNEVRHAELSKLIGGGA